MITGVRMAKNDRLKVTTTLCQENWALVRPYRVFWSIVTEYHQAQADHHPGDVAGQKHIQSDRPEVME